MIRVEMRSMHRRHGPEILATLVVRDDGSHRITGSRRVVDVRQPMLHFPCPRLVSFRDEPVT